MTKDEGKTGGGLIFANFPPATCETDLRQIESTNVVSAALPESPEGVGIALTGIRNVKSLIKESLTYYKYNDVNNLRIVASESPT